MDLNTSNSGKVIADRSTSNMPEAAIYLNTSILGENNMGHNIAKLSTVPGSTVANSRFGVSSFVLHILAMAFMFLDHTWATIGGPFAFTCIGRLAFPMFAFMIAEGFHYTHSVKKYALRMLIFAIVSEIPFNLMMGGTFTYLFHQNVMWTFLISILCLWCIDSTRKKGKIWLTAIVSLLVIAAGYLLGFITMTDYMGYGVLSVIAFYIFRGRKPWQILGQAAGLYWINVVLMGGLSFPLELFGNTIMISQQGLAVLSLIFIWLYNGTQGPYNKGIKYFYYAFYPLHILILSLIALY